MSQTTEILSQFKPISLSDMDSVALMNRVDTKYVVPLENAHTVLQKAINNYQILEIDGKRLFQYRTVYFDTQDHFMLTEHLRGKLNREKVRAREYVGTNARYLEIKFKSNKGRTIKTRIKKTDGLDTIATSETAFLAENASVKPDKLLPILKIRFNRATLVNTKDKERITFDFRLAFDNNKESSELADLVIIEHKRDAQAAHRTELMETLKSVSAYPTSLSKYCIGMILLNEANKYNRYKPKLLKLNKLSTDGNIW